MPSPRRVKILSVLVFVLVIILLFYTSSLRHQRDQNSNIARDDFYSKTVNALDKKARLSQESGDGSEEVLDPGRGTGSASGPGRGSGSGGVQDRLKEAARVAKGHANAKAPKPDPPSAVIGVGSAADGAAGERSVAGRKMYGGEGKDTATEEETSEDHEVEVELNMILKKSPIIIFSKTTCPHSRKAKAILLDKYNISPTPYVVELNEHPMGPQLQARLAKLTNRRTVPNILINGVSIGGGDDISDLHLTKKLVEKVKNLGAKKITQIEEKEADTPEHGLR